MKHGMTEEVDPLHGKREKSLCPEIPTKHGGNGLQEAVESRM
jgi:hypothetical protein